MVVGAAGFTGALAVTAALSFAAGVATFPVALEVAAWAAALTGGFAAAFGVAFVVDGRAAMSVATPVAVLCGTESCGDQQYKLFADRPRQDFPAAQYLSCELRA